jgi:hypothetical protein
LQVSKNIATGVLDAANGVLHAQNYLAEHLTTKDQATTDALALAQSTLSQAQHDGPHAIQIASKTVDDLKNAQAAILKSAHTAVDNLPNIWLVERIYNRAINCT